MMTMMAKIVKSAYVKFGVRKTTMSAITSACAVVTVVAAIGMARYVGYVNGFEDAADQLCV